VPIMAVLSVVITLGTESRSKVNYQTPTSLPFKCTVSLYGVPITAILFFWKELIMKTVNESTIQGIKFTDEDVVNPDDFASYSTGSNPYNMHPFILHNHGFTICIVLASNLQDALDEAVDNNKLDSFLIDEADYADYAMDSDNPTCAFLGNAGEPFDIDCISYIELPMPEFSLCRLLEEE